MKMRLGFLLMLLLACASGAAAGVQLQPEMQVILVDCLVNGREEGRFLLSPSQNATTMISPELAKNLGLQEVDGRATINLDVEGSQFENLSVIVDRYGNYEHAVLKPYAGILGYDIVSKLRLTIDRRNDKISLARSEAGKSPEEFDIRSAHKIETECDTPILTTKAKNGEELRMLLDIGATSSIILPEAAKRVGVFEGGRGYKLDISGDNGEIGRCFFTVGNSPRCEQIMAERGVKIDAVLGMDFLLRFSRVMLDLGNGVVELVPVSRDDVKLPSKAEKGGEAPPAARQTANVLGAVYEFDAEKKTAKITEVLPGGPAAAAKLEAGDIIEKVDGTGFESAERLEQLLKPGTVVELTVKRGEWSKAVKVSLSGNVPPPDQKEAEKIKAMLRGAGFSDAQIETLLQMFELRIKEETPPEAPKEQVPKGEVREITPEVQAAMKDAVERTGMPEAYVRGMVEQLMQHGFSDERIIIELKKIDRWKMGLPEKPKHMPVAFDAVIAESPAQRTAGPLGVAYEFDAEKKTVRIVEVLAGSPAEAAKLEAGDIIEKVDGTGFESAEHFEKLLPPGTAVHLSAKRGEWSKVVNVSLSGNVPPPDQKEAEKIKTMLRGAGFSDAQIETLLNLFELREIKGETPPEAEEPTKEDATEKETPPEAPKKEDPEGEVREITPEVQAAMKWMMARTKMNWVFTRQIVEHFMRQGMTDEQIIEALNDFNKERNALPEKPESEKTDLDRAMEEAVKRGNQPYTVKWLVDLLRKKRMNDEEIIKELANMKPPAPPN